jgi:phosphatidylglycerol:prolipoprotein diacylglycerol transferase
MGRAHWGLIAAAVVCWKNNWHFPKLLDAAAPGLVLAQAIGRLACIITGDAMGKPTNGPFGFAYTNPGAMVPELGVYYAPMPVYEIFANLGIFVVLWQLRKRNWADGKLFLAYLTLYSIERFFLAFTSSYRLIAFGLTQSQITALFGLTISAVLLSLMSRRLNQSVVHAE